MTWTVTQFLSDLKSRLQAPDANGSFTDAEFLRHADQCMLLEMEPLLQSVKSEYYVKSTDTTIVAGTSNYRITHRALGSKLRDVTYVDSNGNESSITEVAPEEAWRYRSGYPAVWSSAGGYMFQGEHIVMLPTPTVAATLRQKYVLRRPQLDDFSNTATITAKTDTTITVDTMPSSIVTGVSIDTIRNKPYFDHLDIDVTATLVAGLVITVASHDSDLAVGDYVALSGYSPVVPLPAEMYHLLLDGTAIRVMQSRGDDSWNSLMQTYERDKQRVLSIFSPRNEGEAPVIINRSSPLRAGRKWGV